MSFSFRDTKDVNPHTGTRVQPDDGDYAVMVSKFELADNKDRSGQNIEAEYTILSGPFSGASVREWLAVVNKSEQAQNIARSKAEAIRRVTKVSENSDLDAVVGKNMVIRVVSEPNEYVDRNGNRRTGKNLNVVNYMDMKRKDASGKEVAEFVPRAKAEDPKQEDRGGYNDRNDYRNDRDQSQTSGGSNDIDDEIPF